MDTLGNSRANTGAQARLHGRAAFVRYKPTRLRVHGDSASIRAASGGAPIRLPPYQLSTEGYCPSVAKAGNGELGLIPERAPEKRHPSKEGSRRANSPIPTR